MELIAKALGKEDLLKRELLIQMCIVTNGDNG
jgi:hypothetical protein